MPAKASLAHPIWRGDAFDFPLRFLDHGVPINLENRTLEFILKMNVNVPDDEAYLTYTYSPVPADGDADAVAGNHIVTLTAEQTAALPIGLLAYQVRLLDQTPDPDKDYTYLWGRAPVKDS